MIQTRHRLLAALAAVVALAVASQASAQSLLILSYSNAKTFGNVHIAGGAIDLTNGAMIVTTSSFGFVPAGGAPNEYGSPGLAEYGDAAIHDALAEGFNVNNGWWNGSNGITSSTAATDPTTSTTVGWIDNQLGFYSTFKTDGQGNPVPVGPGQSIIGYTYFGDADLNGFVDTGDYGLWSAGLGQPVGLNGQNGQMITSYYVPGHEGTPQSILEPVEWPNADLDQSGAVDTGDYGLWSATLGLPALYTPAPVVPAIAGGPASVPEPSTLFLLAVAGLCGLGVRFARKLRA